MNKAPGKCERVSGMICSFLDGELGHSDRLLVVRHCGRCPACDRELSSLRAVKRGLTDLGAAVPDDLLLHRLRDRLADDRKRNLRQVVAVGTVAAVAATAAALIVTSLLAPTSAPPQPANEYAQMESSSDQVYVAGMDNYALPNHAAPVSHRR